MSSTLRVLKNKKNQLTNFGKIKTIKVSSQIWSRKWNKNEPYKQERHPLLENICMIGL